MRTSPRPEHGGVTLNVLLLLVLVLLIVLHWLVLPDASRRNLEFLPDMVDSIPRNAQAPAPPLAGDLRPPGGSIARGHLPLGYGATPEEALRAGRELRNPFLSADPEALERGEFVFTNFCAVCHGPSGLGDGPATRRGVPPPPSLLLDHARQMPDGQIFHVITFGQGNMAAYASQLEREDRWKVILRVRALQEQAEGTPEPEVAENAGEPAGEQEGG